MRGRWFSLLPPGLLGVWLVTGCHQAAGPTSAPPANPPLVVEVTQVRPQPLRDTLSATGSLLAREWVSLQAERAGVIRGIHFEEGQPVRSGQLLVAIDDSELRAQFKRARAQLDLATAIERRDRQLLETGGLVSQIEYDRSLASLNIAGAEVALIEAQLAKTRIVAPFDGIAGLRQVSPGAYLTPGAPVASLRDISSLRLDFSLPERYRNYIRTGQNVTFRIAGEPDTFQATLLAIEPSVDLNTRSLQIRAIAPNEGQRLLPGSFAQVEVPIAEIPDALLIPPIALIPGLEQQTVFVHRDGQVEARLVETGLRTADAVQILAGLQPGDEVAVTGILQLRHGQRVQARLNAPAANPDRPIPPATAARTQVDPPAPGPSTESRSAPVVLETSP